MKTVEHQVFKALFEITNVFFVAIVVIFCRFSSEYRCIFIPFPWNVELLKIARDIQLVIQIQRKSYFQDRNTTKLAGIFFS